MLYVRCKARNRPAAILFSSLFWATRNVRFTFGKNFPRDLKSVFGSIEIWLAIGANMGEGEFLASNSKWGRDIGERAVHVQIYVDSLRELLSLQKSQVFWGGLFHLTFTQTPFSRTLSLRFNGDLDAGDSNLAMMEDLKKIPVIYIHTYIVEAIDIFY